MKTCKRCNTSKSFESFSVVKRKYKDTVYVNRQSYCKPCVVQKFFQWETETEYKPKLRHSRLKQGHMKTGSNPISWNFLKGRSTLDTHKVYPLCSEGHRYVGPVCLKCKYSVPV